MRKPRRGCNTFPVVLICFGAAVMCLCFISVKAFLIVIALALIALGIWLLKCC